MAKVNGTFYTAQRLRRDTTPVSPPYDGSEGQQPPVNPSVRATPPVAIRYGSEAAMTADQINQRSGYLYFDGTNTWWYLGVSNGVIGDYQEFGGGSGLPPVYGSYASQVLMIADQANQLANYFYYDGTQYWEYLGTTAGTIADYRTAFGFWTAGSGFIYRNGKVSIGQSAITLNTTFEIKSLTATETDNILSVLRNGGSTAFKIIENGGTNIPSTNIALGGIPFSSTGDGLRYRASGTSSLISAFLIEDSAASSLFRVLADKTVTMYGSRVLIGNPSSFTPHGLTIKSSDNTNSFFAFEVQNSDAAQIMLLRASGILLLPTARHAFGTTSANVVNGCYFKGSSTTASIFEIANSSDVVRFKVYGNGNIEAQGLPTASAGLTSGMIWNDAGTLKII